MYPERDQLEPPSAGTGFKTPRQQCLPNWEMGRTTGDDCLLVGVSSNLGENTFSLTELVIGTRTDSQTSTLSASSKTVSLQTSCKSKDKEPASGENKQFDPVGKERSHHFEKRMYWYSFLLLKDARAFVPASFFLVLPVCLFRVFFVLFLTYRKKIRWSFFCELKKIWEQR